MAGYPRISPLHGFGRRHQDAEDGAAYGDRARRARDLVRGPSYAVLYRRGVRPPGSCSTSWAGRSVWPRSPATLATAGFAALIHLTAALVGLDRAFELFPIPLLDGGPPFRSMESKRVRGRPPSERAKDLSFEIGFAFVVLLMFLQPLMTSSTCAPRNRRLGATSREKGKLG